MMAFMDKVKSFLGIRQEPPRNDFRNPIWGSDDDDDDDELYTRSHIETYVDPADVHKLFAQQMHDMFKSFGSMFGDMNTFFQNEHFDFAGQAGSSELPDPENHSGNIRDYYLKPGYQNHAQETHEDGDLDGKLSSHEISGLLKQKDGHNSVRPFNGNLVPGKSFCQTIITTSVTKPDGSIETKRIIKNGHEIIEETTTSSEPNSRGPFVTNMDPSVSASFVYGNIMTDLSSLFRNFY